MDILENQVFNEEELKERFRKSKPHLVILYDQMSRLDKIAEKTDDINEQIEITNTMMKIVEVISSSIN
jgi:hypothetical protein